MRLTLSLNVLFVVAVGCPMEMMFDVMGLSLRCEGMVTASVLLSTLFCPEILYEGAFRSSKIMTVMSIDEICFKKGVRGFNGGLEMRSQRNLAIRLGVGLFLIG